MKILLVGDWRWDRYESFFASALRRQGHEVQPVKLQRFFLGKLGNINHAIPNPIFCMPSINRFILKQASQTKPDIAIFWRVTHAFPSTIAKMRKNGIMVISYNNDDPFGTDVHSHAPWHHHFKWWWYKRCLSEFSYNFFYRSTNVAEAEKYGAINCHILLPYYNPKSISPRKPFNDRKDIIFAGHYEPDGREKYIKALVSRGYSFNLYGDKYWTRDVLGDSYDTLSPIRWLKTEEYFQALGNAKIAIVFLSKLNRDKYTRRCFEIPASGTLMLSERTDELVEIFEPDKEACFFSSFAEFFEKLEWLQANPRLCSEIAEAGYRKVVLGGHDIDARAREFVKKISA